VSGSFGFFDFMFYFKLITFFSIFYALFIPYFYIESFAEYQGLPLSISKYQLSILNAFGVPARIIPGILADRFGS
jgi:hypothetical protein